MNKTGLVLDAVFEDHDTGPAHPERGTRLAAIRRALGDRGLVERCERIDPEPIDGTLLERIHDPKYIARVEAACRDGEAFIDTADSAICPKSHEIALLAAGAVVKAVDAVMDGALDNAFCAVRPPGHHAERDRSMGFCLLNNVALAAERLVWHHKLERVLIVDFDVHHCNGTQHTFEHSHQVLVASLHGDPGSVYPGTGLAQETGLGPGRGYTLNLPMKPGADGLAYREAFVEHLLPAVERFEPQFVLISAGFDAHRLDPLAPICLETPDYDWMTRWLMDLATRHGRGRLVSTLEGGYHPGVLGDCCALHLSLLTDYDAKGAAAGHESQVW
ncbi:MAG: histone deacetylase [Phycisphaerae bacterium]